MTLAVVGTVPGAFKNILPVKYAAHPAIMPGAGFLDLEVLLPAVLGLGNYFGGDIFRRKAYPVP